MRTFFTFRRPIGFRVLSWGLLSLSGFSFAQIITPDVYQNLDYRYIGPPGNRTSAVVGVPGDPLTYYVGASSGGVWKTEDGGRNWEPLFDDQPAQSIGALAIAPSDPHVIWAGTGEAFIRSNVSIGNGVYKSTDGGKTWNHMGLEKTGRIGRVVIDPRNPDIVFVAAVGHGYGPQKERGVFRTKDGGKTWEHVLFVDEDTGCFEIAMNMDNPRILFAGMWPIVIKTWGRESGGPNGGVWRSTDGGSTWKRLEKGLPKPPIGKVGLAIAPTNPDVVYALIETGSPNRGVLWRSNNSGDSWRLVSYDRILNERPHYASRIVVSSASENEVYFAANSHSVTYDGGLTSERSGWSGDTHDQWVDPLNPDRIILSDDGGIVISNNHGETWERIRLPIAQMYHVAVDTQIPYYVYGGMQDGSGYRGPSTAAPGRGGWGFVSSEWENTAGGECGFIVPDPVNPNIVWGGSFSSNFSKVNYSTGHERTVRVWPESSYGASASEAKYRFNWTFPITISPHDNNKVYVGSQFVHQTTDGGESWEIISPDLSTNDMSRMGPSGGLTKDNIGVEYACVVFAIAESRVEPGVVWAGTNDGLVHVTRDGGKKWTNVTKNIPSLPEWGTISNIEPSPHNAGTAYITVDFHQMNDRNPYVYKTTNYGKRWRSISNGIPKSVFSYAHWIHEDPVRKGMLYVGTENAIYVSFDDGKNWLPLQNNLPYAPVHHMVTQEHFNDLVVATYGRGFWILDDVTPLRQLNEKVLARNVHLFDLRQAYRMHPLRNGPRPNARALINYYLKDEPEGDVNIAILDNNGDIVRSLKGTKKKGINRVAWNLRYEGAREAKLRTKPPHNPHLVEEKRFRKTWEREGWYPIRSWGTYAGFRGFMVAPGIYSVKLMVGETELTTDLEVLKDPRSEGTLADINDQVALLLRIRQDLNTVSDMISNIEWMKRQIEDLKAVMKGDETSMDIVEKGDALNKKLQELEDKVFQPVLAEGDSKSFRYTNKLYSKLSVLTGDLASGDGFHPGSVDFSPNRQQEEVYKVLKGRVDQYQSEFNRLIEKDVADFNRLAASRDKGGVVVPSSQQQ